MNRRSPCSGSKSPYQSVADAKKSEQPLIWVGSGKIDGNADFSAIMSYALGLKSKIIIGYKGTADMNLAIQRGEADGRVVSEESAVLYGPSGGMRAFVTLARKRAEQFPDVPTLFEAADVDPDAARLVDWRAGIAGLGRLILITPGTPPDRVEFLRGALAEVMQDPAVIGELKKFKLTANYASAGEVARMVEQAMTTLDQAGLAEMRQITLDRYYH